MLEHFKKLKLGMNYKVCVKQGGVKCEKYHFRKHFVEKKNFFSL